MPYLRLCAILLVTTLAGGHAFAKTESLVERGKRMCEEAGVPLEDCTILPPSLRGPEPDTAVAETTPETLPISDVAPTPAAYGAGKYGWCEDCTSLLAAAPVTPWSVYGGRNFQPIRDEDDGRASAISTGSGDTPGNGDPGENDPGNGDDGDSGDQGDNGDSGDQGNNGGEVCD